MKEYTKNGLSEIIEKSKTLHEVLKKHGRNNSSNSYKTLKRKIEKWDIDTSHFLTKREVILKNQKNGKLKKYSDDEIFTENSNVSRQTLKKAFYKYVEYKCALCGQNENWNGNIISLIIDHINGVNNDNRIKNLRLICPNCDAGLPTFCRGNNKKMVTTGKIKHPKPKKTKIYAIDSRKKMRKAERPPYEQLLDEIEKLGYSGTGRKYGVSDTAIRKWKRYYEKYL